MAHSSSCRSRSRPVGQVADHPGCVPTFTHRCPNSRYKSSLPLDQTNGRSSLPIGRVSTCLVLALVHHPAQFPGPLNYTLIGSGDLKMCVSSYRERLSYSGYVVIPASVDPMSVHHPKTSKRLGVICLLLPMVSCCIAERPIPLLDSGTSDIPPSPERSSFISRY